ncbi:MAG: tetratricopeptide repeat protein [Fimbriimonadales bacterium]
MKEDLPDLKAFLLSDLGTQKRTKSRKPLPRADAADAGLSRRIGDERLAEGETTDAIHHYRRAVRQDDADPENRLRLADSYQLAEMGVQAASQYEKLLKHWKSKPEAHVGLAEVYRRYGKHRAGIMRLKKACELNPGNAFYWFKLADALVAAGVAKDAVEPAARAALAEPQDVFYRIWLGDLLLNMGRAEEAVSSFRTALALSPGEDDVYAKLAAALCASGRPVEARAPIQLACDLDPKNEVHSAVQNEVLKRCGQAPLAMDPELDAYGQHALKRWKQLAGSLHG